MIQRLISVLAALLLCGALAAQDAKPDALAMYRSGSFEQAIEICLAEISASPANLESHVVLCWALVQAGRYEEARSWAEKGRKISWYDPRLIEIQGEAYYYLGRNDQSIRLFQEYLSYAPNGSRISIVYWFMGEIYLRQSRFRHADMAFSTAVHLEPLNSRWWVRLGYAREMAREWRWSLEAYNKAIELDSSLSDAVRGRERILKQL